jgi:hypothetical protein
MMMNFIVLLYFFLYIRGIYTKISNSNLLIYILNSKLLKMLNTFRLFSKVASTSSRDVIHNIFLIEL